MLISWMTAGAADVLPVNGFHEVGLSLWTPQSGNLACLCCKKYPNGLAKYSGGEEMVFRLQQTMTDVLWKSPRRGGDLFGSLVHPCNKAAGIIRKRWVQIKIRVNGTMTSSAGSQLAGDVLWS